MAGRVLVVDDEKNITFVIQAMLEKAGYEAAIFVDSREALESLQVEDPDVVITDLHMPGPGGMEILEHCQKNFPQLPVVVITAYGTVESAVSALKRGAFDFITKPFDQTELLNVVRKAVATHRQRLKEPVPIVPLLSLNEKRDAMPAPAISSIIGSSAQMEEVFKIIAKIANSPTTVLVQGESGTGKELVAYEIHRNSDRASKPFVKINCAAIPATLIESELFGYERGAFTGAVASKPGRFELANEGTLFLDEVADMPLEMQVKLLRVLQEHEFERVGGIHSMKVDVRIITASNKELQVEVKAGRFREDLFYRLNVVPIRLPALRERKEDIDLLVRYFVQQFNERLKKQIVNLTPETLSSLRSFSWPGNIRQLENVLERMVLMSENDTLRISDLPPEIAAEVGPVAEATPGDSVSFKELVKKQTQSVERDLIEKALEEKGGNVTRAAEKLGLSRKGLQLKMKELGVRRPE
ncbi:MAG TPA: sigma-54 dependent transcriptional regulator [Bdellovibrionota bacterium]|nr:sigma-54 dependent transcriptional regulator [Bdellovibrionota bacterium]